MSRIIFNILVSSFIFAFPCYAEDVPSLRMPSKHWNALGILWAGLRERSTTVRDSLNHHPELLQLDDAGQIKAILDSVPRLTIKPARSGMDKEQLQPNVDSNTALVSQDAMPVSDDENKRVALPKLREPSTVFLGCQEKHAMLNSRNNFNYWR